MPLPAPYAPPWKRLGEGLVATAAWLGLKGRELWRLNREGTLPVPAFWPRRWPGLFWPVVVALVLVAALALGRLGLAWGDGAGVDRGRGELTAELDLGGAPAPPGPGAAAAGAFGSEAAAPGTLLPEVAAPQASLPAGSLPARSRAAGSLPGAELFLAPGGPPSQTPGAIAPDGTGPKGAASEAPLDGDGRPAPPVDGPVAPPPELASDGETSGETSGDTAGEAPTDLDRLREVLQAIAPDGPVLGLIPDPPAATLTLELADSFLALPLAQRQHRAEQWQQAAASEGYGHLRLRDGRGRPLGRDALVGGGMILLEPLPAVRSTP